MAPHDDDSPRIQRADLLISLGIVPATWAAYGRVLRFDFVSLDDGRYIVNNLHLRDG